MKIWTRFPAFRVLIPFSIGILYNLNVEINPIFWCCATTFGLLISWLLTRYNYFTGKYAQRWLAGVFFYCSFFCLGVLLSWVAESENHHFRFPVSNQNTSYLIRLTEVPQKTKSGFKSTVNVVAYFEDKKWNHCRGNLLVYVKGFSNEPEPSYNDYLIIHGKINEVTSNKNPNAFNYKGYLATKGIYHTVFIDSGKVIFAGISDAFNAKKYATQLRDVLLNRLNTNLSTEDQKGVAGALLLGYDDWLENDLETSFATVGVLHVLCVSGMHVGLIYMIFSMMLNWMEKLKQFRSVKYILLISLIWFYALVTGMAPSVMRASTMLTFVILAGWLNKGSNIYNTLCISCFFLFSINPALIVTAGFQLSFLAVCGIVFFHRLLFPLLNAPNVFLNKVWELLSVSISAQLATFPLSIYLFNQFPNYFLVGNLMVLPLIGFIMYSGLSLMVFGSFALAGKAFGFITAVLIDLLNSIVKVISSLPGALTENCYLSLAETCCLYLILIVVPLWLVKKHKWLMLLSLGSIFIFLSVHTTYLLLANQKSEMVVYHQKNNMLLALFHGRKAIVISDTILDQGLLKYSAAADFNTRLITDTNVVVLNNQQILLFPNERIVIVKHWLKDETLDSNLAVFKPEFLILGEGVEATATKLNALFHPKHVILTQSYFNWKLRKRVEDWQKLNVPVHQIATEGFFKGEVYTIR